MDAEFLIELSQCLVLELGSRSGHRWPQFLLPPILLCSGFVVNRNCFPAPSRILEPSSPRSSLVGAAGEALAGSLSPSCRPQGVRDVREALAAEVVVVRRQFRDDRVCRQEAGAWETARRG